MSFELDNNQGVQIDSTFTASESAQIIKSVKPKHPALKRLHTELQNAGGTSTITAYDRMHHRHNRS